MASLKDIARECIDEAREGIAWTVLWRAGTNWKSKCFYAPVKHCEPVWRAEDLEALREIAEKDPNAIATNVATSDCYYTLRDDGAERLEKELRFRYKCNLNLLSRTLPQKEKKRPAIERTREDLPSYKSFDKQHIGESDIAMLTMVGAGHNGVVALSLKFGGDESYSAYIVDKPAEIGAHYELVGSFKHWLKIYDDTSLTASFSAQRIRVWRAACYGCIIELLDDEEED